MNPERPAARAEPAALEARLESAAPAANAVPAARPAPAASGFVARALRAHVWFGALVERLHSPFALAARLYLANVFFSSGMIKLSSWDSTLALFANEYHVPLLSPHAAAVLGTAAEVGLPVFIALGLGTRLAAVALFVFNLVAATSYPDLSPAGLKDHILWGTLIVVLFVYGPGKIALDRWLERGIVH